MLHKRRRTHSVSIGHLSIGADHPIRVQSMTTTNTMDTQATVEQTIELIEAGSDFVRLTVPSIKDANNLIDIKKKIRNKGYKTPLIADIHFTPRAAEIAAGIVEKVRINPGNYIDKKKFEIKKYDNHLYEQELEKIRVRFTPLVNLCKQYGTAMRIGTNHGSLSDRIMNYYGDTPMGMVESALEFVRICEDLDYYDIVLSMKASNPKIMIEAYRLLVKSLKEQNLKSYPLHLGVTEAGDGLAARVKSALGIGVLLEEGLGDTIRVSLTEAPQKEIPVANHIIEKVWQGKKTSFEPTTSIHFSVTDTPKNRAYENIGGKNVSRVLADFSCVETIQREDVEKIGYTYFIELDKWHIGDQAADYIYLNKKTLGFTTPVVLKKIVDYQLWEKSKNDISSYPLFFSLESFLDNSKHGTLNFIELSFEVFEKTFATLATVDFPVCFIIDLDANISFRDYRDRFSQLLTTTAQPIILKKKYTAINNVSISASIDLGGLLIEGFGQGIFMPISPNIKKHLLLENIKDTNKIAFTILQACRLRFTKTEYISCPSCGRTLFDLEETTAKIQEKTEHLKGVKIAIMGCIVNGPGEMADADYGYVGSGKDKITLYRGKEVIKKNVPSRQAVEELITIIKEDKLWIEKEML